MMELYSVHLVNDPALCYSILHMKRLKSLFTLSGPGLLRLFLLFALVAWGFLLGPLRAYSNSILIGGLISLGAVFAIAGLFYFITLWLAGPHMLPVHPRNKHEKKEARRLLQRFGMGGHVAMGVVREASIVPGPNGESRDRLTGPGVIELDSSTAAVLLTDTGQSRIREPGLIFLRDQERLGALVDLRIQLRADEFEFLTRDGIPVKTRVAVRFQIDQTHFSRVQVEAPAHPLPAPLITSQRSIRRALRNQSVQASGETSKWHDMPLSLAQGILRTMIADYKFDELLQPQEPTANPRAAIRKDLEDRVKFILAQRGIKLLTLGLGIFFPIDDVPNAIDLRKKNPITYQRLETWKAEWDSRMLKIMAQAEAEAERQRDLARTQAQMELIMRVTQALEQGATEGSDQDQIARRFLATLQRMADEPFTRERLSEDNLRLLRDLMGSRGGPGSSDQEPLTTNEH